MLEELVGRRLRAVERLAWHPDDTESVELNVGPVHLWFDDGRSVHITGAGDFTLRWELFERGDDGWLGRYDYHFGGRWVVRDSTQEEPFVGLVGNLLNAATPEFNEVNEVTGMTLDFHQRKLGLMLVNGEITT